MQLSLQKSLYQPVYTIKKKETENDVCGNARLRCTGVMGAGGSGLAGNFGGGETQHCNAVTCCASAAVPGTAAQGRKSGCEGLCTEPGLAELRVTAEHTQLCLAFPTLQPLLRQGTALRTITEVAQPGSFPENTHKGFVWQP